MKTISITQLRMFIAVCFLMFASALKGGSSEGKNKDGIAFTLSSGLFLSNAGFGVPVNVHLKYYNRWGLAYNSKRIDNDYHWPYIYLIQKYSTFRHGDELRLRSLSLTREVFPDEQKGRTSVELGLSHVKLVRWIYSYTKEDPKFGLDFMIDKSENSYFKTYKSIGLNMKLRHEFILSKVTGIEFSVFANLNPIYTLYGAELCLVIGKMY